MPKVRNNMPDMLSLVAVYVFLLLILFALRLPIGLALALVGTLGFVFFLDPGTAGKAIAMKLHSSLYNFTITAIPLFVLMAEIVARGGGSKVLYDAITPVAERLLPGGLIHANIVTCAMFGAVCGSALGGTAAVAGVAMPELKKRGYNPAFALGSLAAAGPLALTIPPSMDYIIFGALTGTSVGKLFIAGIIPGILLAGLMMLATLATVKFQPELVPRRPKEMLAYASYIVTVGKALPLLLLALSIIYSIYGGIATPTEAAAIGVGVAVVITLVYRQLNWRRFLEAVGATVRITATLLFLYVGASIYAVSLANVGLIALIKDTFLALPAVPLATAAIMLVGYTFMGMFIDGLSMILIATPITFPIFIALGFHPIWVGVIVVLMGEIGCITPPVGVTLFLLQGMSGEDPLSIAKGAIPFFIALMAGAIILLFFPVLTTWLPSYMV